MLRIQSDQLAEQRRINERQTEVLALQAAELRGSLAERKREAVERQNPEPYAPSTPLAGRAIS